MEATDAQTVSPPVPPVLQPLSDHGTVTNTTFQQPEVPCVARWTTNKRLRNTRFTNTCFGHLINNIITSAHCRTGRTLQAGALSLFMGVFSIGLTENERRVSWQFPVDTSVVRIYLPYNTSCCPRLSLLSFLTCFMIPCTHYGFQTLSIVLCRYIQAIYTKFVVFI